MDFLFLRHIAGNAKCPRPQFGHSLFQDIFPAPADSCICPFGNKSPGSSKPNAFTASGNNGYLIL